MNFKSIKEETKTFKLLITSCFEDKSEKIFSQKSDNILYILIRILYKLNIKNIYCLDLLSLKNNEYDFLIKNEKLINFDFEEVKQVVLSSEHIEQLEEETQNLQTIKPIVFLKNKLFFRKNYLEQKKILKAFKKKENIEYKNTKEKIPFEKKKIFFYSKKNRQKEHFFFSSLMIFFKENQIAKEKILFLTTSFERIFFLKKYFKIESFLISKHSSKKNDFFKYVFIDDFFNISISHLSEIVDDLNLPFFFFGNTCFAIEYANIELINFLKEVSFDLEESETKQDSQFFDKLANQQEKILDKTCNWLRFNEKQIVDFLEKKILLHYQKYFELVSQKNAYQNCVDIFKFSKEIKIVTLTQEKIGSFYWLKNFFYYKILKKLNICNSYKDYQEKNYIGKKIIITRNSHYLFKHEEGILLKDQNDEFKFFFLRGQEIISFFPEEIDYFQENFFTSQLYQMNCKNIYLFFPKQIEDRHLLSDLFKMDNFYFYFFIPNSNPTTTFININKKPPHSLFVKLWNLT